ncbi:MAG: multiple sugar transport system permease protein [Thermomicrobiales bacterium]|nr:multiple sugar transport system permease protein [Thermomicrobiales bacterium]MEA2598566.1 multiple sugar transport system permease protein [Thermomicrobiales bacterium]
MSAETARATSTRSVPFWKQRKWESTIAFWAFMSPMLIGLAIFTFTPIVWGFLISLSNARNTVSISDFVGLNNYGDILRDDAFRKSLRTIVIFTAFIVPLTFVVSLALAMLVNGVGFGRPFFRTVFFIPTAISYVIASLVWRMAIFNGTFFGVANMALYEIFGYEKLISWISPPAGDPPWYWLVLVTVRLWLQVGFYMIIFIAGLQEIPRDLYEAAYVDGARSGWRTFRDITLPMLRNTSIAVLLLNFIAAFQAFDEFFNIFGSTGASSGNLSLARPPLVYLYQIGISNQNYGLASAGAFILTALIIVVTLVQGRIFGFGRSTAA